MMTCHPTKESYTQEFKRGTERESVGTSHISCPPYFPSISGGYQDTPLQRQSLLFLAKLRKKGTTRTLFIGVKLHSKLKVLYSRKLFVLLLVCMKITVGTQKNQDQVSRNILCLMFIHEVIWDGDGVK